MAVRQLRLVVAVEEYGAAVAFYRDVLGMTQQEAIGGPGGAHVTILDAGRATLELANPEQRRYIDRVEVGREDVAPRLRVALEVDDAPAATADAVAAGAARVAPPTETPWRSLNARLDAPGDLQITLFQELGPPAADASVTSGSQPPADATRSAASGPDSPGAGASVASAPASAAGAATSDRGSADAPAGRGVGSAAERRARDAGISVREATGEDWPGIWPILRRIAAAGETYTWPRDIGEAAARSVWMEQPPGRTVVAVDADGTVVGSAATHPNHDGAGAHVANAGFLVEPDHAGRGIGRLLAEHVIEQARADGYRAMQFNAVVETNAQAVALWRSLGFEILATVPEAFDHPTAGLVGLHVMHCRL